MTDNPQDLPENSPSVRRALALVGDPRPSRFAGYRIDPGSRVLAPGAIFSVRAPRETFNVQSNVVITGSDPDASFEINAAAPPVDPTIVRQLRYTLADLRSLRIEELDPLSSLDRQLLFAAYGELAALAEPKSARAARATPAESHLNLAND